ncbi:MAG: hypothetical protein J7K88_00020, partial [Candidatus Fermentibacteraceae bacterium]|nr:hypothetical protein [Candidatus Fermentibacteraceae bacterium]
DILESKLIHMAYLNPMKAYHHWQDLYTVNESKVEGEREALGLNSIGDESDLLMDADTLSDDYKDLVNDLRVPSFTSF